MTRDELYRKRMMFQIYSSRNQMPKIETNANNEPLKHSATNDYLEYRKKVAAGVRIQKENNKSNLFNVTEANEQYYQDLMDQNIIIHAGTYKPAGTHEYVAVLPDFWGKGKHRYFYTQQEWDNYQKNAAGAGQAGANRGAREGADAKNKALATAGQNAYADSRKNAFNATVNSAKKDLQNKNLAEAGQKAFENSQKNSALTTAQSRREAAIANSKGDSKDDAQDVTNTVKDYNASKREWEKNSQANPEAQRAQKMRENAEKEDTDNISNTVKNYNASKREWEKNSQANPEAQRGAKESERANAQKQAANQSGSANAAKSQGEAYDEYMNNKKMSANQSGSANAAKSEGEGYDRYKKDLADKEELRKQVEQEEINAENYAKNKSDSKGIDKAAKDRAIKESADSILNSKNPAKEIANNKMISKDIDVIIDMLNDGVADFNKDGRIHIDKSKNPKAVEYIQNSDLGAMYNALLQGGMSKRSIDAAITDEIEKRYKASKESKVQNAVGKFAQKGGQKDIANAIKGMSDSKAKHLAANQSGSGNAAREAGEKQDIAKAKKAREEEDAKAKRYDDRYEKNNGKKKYATSVKHFAFEEEEEEEVTPEQEYLNFRAKVEAGMKHFGLMRGLMSVPVNQGLKNGESLMHAGTGKYGDYYNKIDNYYGPGKARYFQTKDEWDAHQRELEGYKKKAEKDVAERDRKIAQQNEWNKNSQANPGAQRGAQQYVTGKITNKQNQKDTANKNYYNTQSKSNPEQRRGFTEAAQGRLAGSNFTPSVADTNFNSTPTNLNLYGADSSKTTAARNAYQSSYRNDLLNKAQSGREAAINNSAPGIDKDIQRRKFLEANQSGREAAIKNSGSLGGTSTNDDGTSKVTVVIEKIPENVQQAWAGREGDEKAATKRTMITMAYDKAVKDYNEVAKDIDREYGLDQVETTKDLVKAYTNLIKDTEKVISKGNVPNPDNVKYESLVDGNNAQYAAYIQDYASEILRLESVKQDLQNEYDKTIQLASSQSGNGFRESHQRATELFDQMMDINEQINWLNKESLSKVYPYLAAVYK